jgi:cytochrome b-561
MTIGFGFLSVQGAHYTSHSGACSHEHKRQFLLSVVISFPAIIGFKALPFKHTTKKAIHGIFHFIAFGCATVAIVVVFLFKKSHGYDHLYSVHSWVGFGAYILYGLQFFFGLFMFVFPRGSDRIRAAFMPHHTYWGACIWAGTIIAIATGVLDRLTVTDLSGGPYTIDTLVVRITNRQQRVA